MRGKEVRFYFIWVIRVGYILRVFRSGLKSPSTASLTSKMLQLQSTSGSWILQPPTQLLCMYTSNRLLPLKGPQGVKRLAVESIRH